jgi:hypothetical protein
MKCTMKCWQNSLQLHALIFLVNCIFSYMMIRRVISQHEKAASTPKWVPAQQRVTIYGEIQVIECAARSYLSEGGFRECKALAVSSSPSLNSTSLLVSN